MDILNIRLGDTQPPILSDISVSAEDAVVFKLSRLNADGSHTFILTRVCVPAEGDTYYSFVWADGDIDQGGWYLAEWEITHTETVGEVEVETKQTVGRMAIFASDVLPS